MNFNSQFPDGLGQSPAGSLAPRQLGAISDRASGFRVRSVRTSEAVRVGYRATAQTLPDVHDGVQKV